MHPDLPNLIDLQAKDRTLAEAALALADLEAEAAGLDAAVAAARSQVTQATRLANDAVARRTEREAKVEAQRTNQEKRRTRLESERSPRIAAQLMADVELGRSILAQEESDWLRLAEETTTREAAVAAAEQGLAAIETEQLEARADLAARTAEAQAAHDAAREARDAAAELLPRPIRQRYERLRGPKGKIVLYAATGATCTACHTAIPTSRVGVLRAEGMLLDGCEMCGAILYLVETPA
jgi:predicted  nucleic acid-binding Zn-ribbon protein